MARKEPENLLDYKTMHALSNPKRVRILAILAERVASPKEIAAELDQALSQASYHVTVLRECGLAVEDHRVPRRGAVEHFYRAVAPTLIPPGAWANLPPAVRKGISVRILRKFFEDASASLKAGIFEKSPAELGWTPLVLDERGIEDIDRLTRDFMQSVLDVQAETSKRLSKAREKQAKTAISATVFVSSFRSVRSPEEGKKAAAAKRR